MPKKEARARAMELLKTVGLEEKAKAYPVQLSGRTETAGGHSQGPGHESQVILCDEATSALDPNTTKSILALLKEINQKMGVTVIMITHEMSVIESICSRVAIIDQSRIAEVGSVSEIFSEPKTRIGRQLILGDAIHQANFGKSKKVRIIFDGRESEEPVISNLVLACRTPVNILYAATRDLDWKGHGPDDHPAAGRRDGGQTGVQLFEDGENPL